MISINSILCGILHVGNIEFIEKDGDHQTQMDISNSDILAIGENTRLIEHKIQMYPIK